MTVSRLGLGTALLAVVAHSADVHYHLDLTWEVGAPNGQERQMIKVNGQFPGPPLILDEGDDVTVVVNNCMPFNTSVHFHGIEQLGTPWSDGVPGLSQWAIEPNKSFTYNWHANAYGTYWYHAHHMASLQDGLYGAIRIRPAPDTRAPFSLISPEGPDIKDMKLAEQNAELIIVSDWDHLLSWDYMDAMRQTGYDIFCTDSVLIQGKGSVFCKPQEELDALLRPSVRQVLNTNVTDKGCLPPVRGIQGDWEHHPEKLPEGLNSGCVPSEGSEAVFHVDPAKKWASLNFVGAASLKALVVSIDEHPMYVYEVDGRYIEPQLVHSFDLYNGERYSVLIRLDQEPGNYKIRIAGTGGNQIISGFATLSYAGGEANAREPIPYIDYGGQNTTADVIPLDVTNLPPFPPVYPAAVADDFHLLQLGRVNSSWQWSLDGANFYPSSRDDMAPLHHPDSTNLSSALTITTRNNTWVDIVFQLNIGDPAVTPVQPPHPMHKHSNKAFVIGQGQGRFAWTSVEDGVAASPQNFFLDRPLYRDTFVTSPRGESWLAVRYHVVNPGAFFLHCHMETHLFSGMGVVLLDGIDAWPEAPQPMVGC